MWWLFNAPVTEDSYIPAFVLDNGDKFPIDEEYVELGMREGWLIWDGYRWDNGKPWRLYLHI